MVKFPIEIGLIFSSLMFYADYDNSFDAVFSLGDGKATIEVDQYEPLLTIGGGGKFGEAAEFVYEDKLESIWTKDVIRYPAKGNFPYKHGESFDGTIGMWLKIDLEQLMERSLIWLDPIHLLAENDRDNGKIWMDFVTTELPDTPIFRFGATSRRGSAEEKARRSDDHVIVIPHIDFKGDSWHHIIGTWENLNASGNQGKLQLYVDGVQVGAITGFDHQLDWHIEDWEIRVGLGFKGKIDDFFILNSFLSARDVKDIYHAEKSLGDLLGL